jgi:primase-polymerase (primpol)-like protein
MTCSVCGVRLPFLIRDGAVTCSPRCRVALHRSLPASVLRDVPRWVRYSARKVPLQSAGGIASSTNPATWSTFDQAASSRVGVGYGFVLSHTDRIMCVDIDGCLDDRGRAKDWLQDLLPGLPATYVEVSPSGHGLHVWGFGDVTRGIRSGGVEVYGTGRFITVTGKRWRKCAAGFADLNGWVSSLDL